MTALGWGRLYGVGVKQLDADHRIISELTRQLDDAVETGQSHDVVANVVTAIVEFTQHHMRREQSVSADSDEKPSSEHVEFHREIIDRLEDLLGQGCASRSFDQDIVRIKHLSDQLLRADSPQDDGMSMIAPPQSSMSGASHGT